MSEVKIIIKELEKILDLLDSIDPVKMLSRELLKSFLEFEVKKFHTSSINVKSLLEHLLKKYNVSSIEELAKLLSSKARVEV